MFISEVTNSLVVLFVCFVFQVRKIQMGTRSASRRLSEMSEGFALVLSRKVSHRSRDGGVSQNEIRDSDFVGRFSAGY